MSWLCRFAAKKKRIFTALRQRKPKKNINNNKKKQKTMEVKVTAENFESLKKEQLPVLVDFWAEWCGPCKMISPVISQLADEYDGKLIVAKCDVEECEDIAAELGIRNIPTLLFFKDGQIIDRLVGAVNKMKIQEKINAIL